MAIPQLSAQPLAYLGRFTPCDVGPRIEQRATLAWLIAAMNHAGIENSAERLYARLERATHIDSRSLCHSDFTHQRWDEMTLFSPSDGRPWYAPSLQKRMQAFSAMAHRSIEQAFSDSEEAPGYIAQVSCTGYESPNAMQALCLAKGWQAQTRLLHVGHMGCYAALPATEMAARLVASSTKKLRASVFLVEACSVHTRLDAMDSGQLINAFLFADGAIRLDALPEPEAHCLAYLDGFETIVPDSAAQMTWHLADAGFQMYLAVEVPMTIGKKIAAEVDRFLARHALDRSDIAEWAIHPGGTKIIEEVVHALGLAPTQARHSLAVFRERGNMSSTTVPHIWTAMAQDVSVKEGALIVSLAFGPGLTVTGNLLRKGA